MCRFVVSEKWIISDKALQNSLKQVFNELFKKVANIFSVDFSLEERG